VVVRRGDTPVASGRAHPRSRSDRRRDRRRVAPVVAGQPGNHRRQPAPAAARHPTCVRRDAPALTIALAGRSRADKRLRRQTPTPTEAAPANACAGPCRRPHQRSPRPVRAGPGHPRTSTLEGPL
jgi:hypothetical protein